MTSVKLPSLGLLLLIHISVSIEVSNLTHRLILASSPFTRSMDWRTAREKNSKQIARHNPMNDMVFSEFRKSKVRSVREGKALFDNGHNEIR